MDAFSRSWTNYICFVFPPFSLILHVPRSGVHNRGMPIDEEIIRQENFRKQKAEKSGRQQRVEPALCSMEDIKKEVLVKGMDEVSADICMSLWGDGTQKQ